MKSLMTAAAAALMLGGCVAVPYYAEPAPVGGYYYDYHVYPAVPTVHFHYEYRRSYRDHRPYRHYRR
jgi:hypothetical protein